jgi:hypothetical protein
LFRKLPIRNNAVMTGPIVLRPAPNRHRPRR